MLSDLELAYWQLKKDLYFKKIPPEKILLYCQQALDRGTAYALFFEEHTLFSLLKKYPLTVVENSTETNLRGQLSLAKKNTHGAITLFTTNLKQLHEKTQLPLKQIRQAALAHELYHYFSELNLGPQNLPSMATVKTFSLGPLQRNSSLRQLTEISAHRFAQEMAQLPFLANAFDCNPLWSKTTADIQRLDALTNEYTKLKTLED